MMQSGYNPESKAEQSERVTLMDSFQQGDLVFGLQAIRRLAINDLKEKGFHYVFANALNNRVVSMIVMGEDPHTLQPEKMLHYHFLNQHKDYLMRANGKPIPGMKKSDEISAAYRRSCKALVTDRSNQTRNIHFLLKNIDWKRVCTKLKNKNDENEPDVAVTASELRAAYRDYKLHGKHPRLFFYNDNNERLNILPWEMPEYKYLWDSYDAARLSKKTLEDIQLTPEEDTVLFRSQSNELFCHEFLSELAGSADPDEEKNEKPNLVRRC